MFPDNLTRDEAEARALLVRTGRCRLTIDLGGVGVEDPESSFLTTCTVWFDGLDSGVTHLDLIADEVLTAHLDGEPLPTDDFDGSRLPLSVEPGPHELTVRARHRYSHSGEGLHRFLDPADGSTYLYSQCEPADARRIFGCFDQPDLKACFEITVIAPQDWTVVSCGTVSAVEDAGGGLSRWQFTETAPISPYLVGLCAGHYHLVEDAYVRTDGGSVPLRVLCRRSLVPHLDAGRIFEITAAGFEVFERHFDYPYPFVKYDQIFVPEYNGGAMENVGCVTLRDEYLFRGRTTDAAFHQRDITILHELSHMWFGNLVTMTWWDDLWLKESFATWASHFAWGEIIGREQSWAVFSYKEKTWAYRQDQLPSTHPVAADMVDLEAVQLNFDGITYAKGASVLIQLVAFVGEEEFLAGLRSYFRRHAYGNTRLPDLLAALTASSGRDLRGWSAQWLETAGVNQLQPVVSTDDDGTVTRFEVLQTASAAWPQLRRHRLTVGSYDIDGDHLVRTARDVIEIDGQRTRLPLLEGRRRAQWYLLNDVDATYAKVRFEPNASALTADLPELADPVAKAVAVQAVWDMCRDAQLPPALYVSLVLRAAPRLSDSTSLTACLAQAHCAALELVDRSERDALWADWEAGLTQLLATTEPGSDAQLAVTRAFVVAARSPVAADRLLAWLAGHDLPQGLHLDRPLRWTVVVHLARLGRMDEAAVAREESTDRTITGAEQAAAARSAMPWPHTKAAAWDLAVASNRVSNEAHRAICRAFWQPGQDALLAPYAERYLEIVGDISDGRGVWATNAPVLRTTAVRDLFPHLVDPAVFLPRLDSWVADRAAAGRELADYVRRVLGERRDEALRTVRCQQADRARACASVS